MNREWMNKSTREDKILFAGFKYLKVLEMGLDNHNKKKLLKTISEPKKNHSPNEMYGTNGSRFSNKHLEEVGGLPIMYPIEWMSDYVCIEHKTQIDNHDDVILRVPSDFLKSIDLYYVFMYMKPNLLGLFAYIVLNTKDEKVFNSALLFLDLYRQYYIACLTNDLYRISKYVNEHKEWLQSSGHEQVNY
jgi:hypothetical protein